jgi:hypothetical protein
VKIILPLDTSGAETDVDTEPAAIRAWAKRRAIYVELRNGEIVAFPADRFPILSKATRFYWGPLYLNSAANSPRSRLLHAQMREGDCQCIRRVGVGRFG